jgi:glutaredoxin
MAAVFSGCPQKGNQQKNVSAKAQKGLPQTVSEKAKVEFYVMSQCPFGLQVEKGIAPVLKKMGGDLDFSLDFIGGIDGDKLSSMHGQTEIDGDRIQVCAAKYYPGSYMDMIQCMNKNMRGIPDNWEDCAQQVGFDANQLKECYAGPEGKKLLKASFERARKRNARGSPTIFIGNKSYRGQRSEIAFTRVICNAFPKDKPQLCNEIPPPVNVPITIVSDKRCTECRTQFWANRMKKMFLGAKITNVDYTEAQGQKLYGELKLSLLPAILMGKEVEKAENYKQISRFLEPVGEFLLFRSGAKFDPTKEICTNGKDDTGNGKVDCDDADCTNKLLCRKETPKKLDVFVMSQCPYGVKALNAIPEVLSNFKNGIEVNVHFIATEQGDGFKSLHGQPEVDENIRELCAIKYYNKNYKYMDYITCRNKNIRSNDWKSCTGKNGIDTDKISKCFEGDEGKNLLRKDIKIAQELEFSASPTWLANNKFKFSAIDAETIKRNMCQNNKSLKNCDKKLSAGKPGGGSCN